jgi:hypothetical protein
MTTRDQNERQGSVRLRFSLYQRANLPVLECASYQGDAERHRIYLQTSRQQLSPVVQVFKSSNLVCKVLPTKYHGFVEYVVAEIGMCLASVVELGVWQRFGFMPSSA